MSKEINENLKRNVIELEEKVRKLTGYRNILINLLDETKTNQNIKLNNLLKNLQLEEEISYLKDWIEFYKEKIVGYKTIIETAEKELPKQEFEETKSKEILEEKEPKKELLEQELEDLDKEAKKIVEKKEQKEEPEEEFEIELPSQEELEKEAKRIEEAEKEEKPEIKVEEEKVKVEDKKPIEIAKPARIEVKEEETKKQIKELFEEKKVIRPIRFKETLQAIKEPITNIFEIAKKFDRQKLIRYAVPAVMLLLIVSVLFVFKPEITGYVTLTREETYTDDLNLIINESSNYTWTPDKIGDIESIKASGKVKGNGTAKIYIEKDGERYLIYDSKKANIS